MKKPIKVFELGDDTIALRLAKILKQDGVAIIAELGTFKVTDCVLPMNKYVSYKPGTIRKKLSFKAARTIRDIINP